MACRRVSLEGFCFYGFRHTGRTNLHKAGVRNSITMAMSGHKAMAMFKRYNKIDLDDGREAMRKLEIYISANQKKQNELKQQEGNGIPYCNSTAEALGEPLAYA